MTIYIRQSTEPDIITRYDDVVVIDKIDDFVYIIHYDKDVRTGIALHDVISIESDELD